MKNPDYIIDVHQHLWGQQKEDYSENTLELLLETNGKDNIKESWLSCVELDGRPWDGTGDDFIEDAFQRYPDKIRGMGFILLGRDGADKVREFKDRGFFGLKIIFPLSSYDDPAFNEVWEEAIKQKMPVTFHTGESVGGFPPNHSFHPLDMAPDRLFRVKGYFPKLIMLIAHMGNTRFQDACALAMGKNIYLDCSGGGNLKAMPKSYFDNTVYWKEVQHKIAFGVDQLFSGIPNMIQNSARFAETVELSEENQQLMWHGNAERIIAQTKAK
ncbi:MAG: amidohydrolase family protein [bacterium]